MLVEGRKGTWAAGLTGEWRQCLWRQMFAGTRQAQGKGAGRNGSERWVCVSLGLAWVCCRGEKSCACVAAHAVRQKNPRSPHPRRPKRELGTARAAPSFPQHHHTMRTLGALEYMPGWSLLASAGVPTGPPSPRRPLIGCPCLLSSSSSSTFVP